MIRISESEGLVFKIEAFKKKLSVEEQRPRIKKKNLKQSTEEKSLERLRLKDSGKSLSPIGGLSSNPFPREVFLKQVLK